MKRVSKHASSISNFDRDDEKKSKKIQIKVQKTDLDSLSGGGQMPILKPTVTPNVKTRPSLHNNMKFKESLNLTYR